MTTTTDSNSDSGGTSKAGTWWQRSARRVWLTIRIVGVIAALAAAAWWLLLSPVVVTTYTVATGTVMAEVLGTGTLEARVSATLGPKIAGLITRVAVDEGDRVKSGDTLISLEDTDLKQQAAIAEAEVAAAAAGLERLHADARRAEAVLVKARQDHQRISDLVANNSAAADEFNQAVEALAIAEAEQSRADAAIVEGQKRLAAANRSLDYQQARLHDTTIEAPFDGLVVRRDRDAGDVVTAGSSVLQQVSLEEMWITAWVDETELARLAEGQTARVAFRSEPGVEYPGAVARVGREADRETREIVVDVRVETLPANWAVGQRAEVYIRTDRKENVPVLPAGLVLVREGNTGVMVDGGGKARWREITVGLRGRESVEIKSGLSLGDIVVRPAAPGAGPLRDGRRVTAR